MFGFGTLEALPGILMLSAWLQFSELCGKKTCEKSVNDELKLNVKTHEL